MLLSSTLEVWSKCKHTSSLPFCPWLEVAVVWCDFFIGPIRLRLGIVLKKRAFFHFFHSISLGSHVFFILSEYLLNVCHRNVKQFSDLLASYSSTASVVNIFWWNVPSWYIPVVHFCCHLFVISGSFPVFPCHRQSMEKARLEAKKAEEAEQERRAKQAEVSRLMRSSACYLGDQVVSPKQLVAAVTENRKRMLM